MIDLSDNFGPVYDQGAVGSCAVCAFAGVFYYELNKYNKNKTLIQHLLNNLYNIVKKYEFLEKILKEYYFPKTFFPSRYYLYYYACANNYYNKEDKDKDKNVGGTTIEFIISTINQYGIIEELIQETTDNSYSWLYEQIDDNPTDLNDQNDQNDQTDILIDPTIIENASYWKYKIKYIHINKDSKIHTDIPTIKNYLAEEKPIIITINVSTFKTSNKSNDESYIVKLENIIRSGGHAMVIVGYDDSLNAFKIRNSYGKHYGKDGYFWLDYEFFGDNAEFESSDDTSNDKVKVKHKVNINLYILELKI